MVVLFKDDEDYDDGESDSDDGDEDVNNNEVDPMVTSTRDTVENSIKGDRRRVKVAGRETLGGRLRKWIVSLRIDWNRKSVQFHV